jgi:Universal stress protein family
MRHEERYVLAALDRGTGTSAVRIVAQVVADHFDVPVREVYVTPGPGLRGAARQAAATKVERGESSEVQGRPVDILTGLVESPGAVLSVFGTGDPSTRPSPRRPSGTAFSVARRVDKPMVLVPASLEKWEGPQRVLVPLDGTGITALAASAALAELSVPDTVATTVHVFDERTVPQFWDSPQHEYEAWTKEFRARYCEAIGEGLEVRAGPVSDQLADMAVSGTFDMVVVVWSQQTHGGRAAVVADLLARSTVPILLVPSSFVPRALSAPGHTGTDAEA